MNRAGPNHGRRAGLARRAGVLTVLAGLTVLVTAAQSAPPESAADGSDEPVPTARKRPTRSAGDDPDETLPLPSRPLRERPSVVAGEEDFAPAAGRLRGLLRRESATQPDDDVSSPQRRPPSQRPTVPAGAEVEPIPMRTPRPTVAVSGEAMMGSTETDTAPPPSGRTPTWVWLFLAAGLGLVLWLLMAPPPSSPPDNRGTV